MVRRSLHLLRRSMTAQISLAIMLVSVLIITSFGLLIDRFLAQEFREENELMLLANLAFIRDDLAASHFDLAEAQRLVDRTERRVHRLHAAILDEQDGRIIASSANYAVPVSSMPQQVLSSAELPAEVSVTEVEGLRERLGALTTIWTAPAGDRYRMLVGRIVMPAQDARPVRSLLVALAIEPTQTRELRKRDQRDLLIALSVAAVVASLFGVWIARRILVNARRLGAAASRIGAQALQERLPLDDTPVELIESTLAFNHMLDRLQNAFERLSAFSSDLAHDLRTPISTLLGEAQVALSRTRSAEEYRAVLESAVDEYERLSRTIANMLFLAHVDNDQAALTARWIALDAALERVISYFELLAEERGITLRKEVRATPGVEPRVWADETMLIRALSNLVSNALRYAPRGTCIELTATVESGRSCSIEVSNEGTPIAAEHLPHIFERFYRADPSRQDSASGSGLGLAIVRSIMDLHRGQASVQSGAGLRTVFSLQFPAPQGAT
jgi:two-component system heavy metal sensor histidine kinase CusS